MVALLPFALFRFVWKNRKNPDARRRWKERLGILDFQSASDGVIWIHAVSVGESNVAQPLTDRILANYPNSHVVVSTTTATGAEMVIARYPREVTHVYFPFDIKACVRASFAKLNPKLVVLIETELWPNFLAVAEQKGVPVVLINARLSERAADKYRRISNLMKRMLGRLDLLVAQSEEDAERFLSLGAAQDKLVVTGSLKFDREPVPSTLERGEAIRRELGQNRFVLMAGSTRDGEEQLLLGQITALRAKIPNFLMVLAPRHPERFDQIADLLEAQQIPYQRYQDNRSVSEATQVFLLDVMGELTHYYAASDLAFVGGSLKPFGGQNTLEPAGLGVPILVGPYTYNFTAVNRKLAKAGALVETQTEETLTRLIIELSIDSDRRDRMGLSGKKVFRDNRGALKQVEILLAPYLASIK